jgi:hypothetical protein
MRSWRTDLALAALGLSLAGSSAAADPLADVDESFDSIPYSITVTARDPMPFIHADAGTWIVEDTVTDHPECTSRSDAVILVISRRYSAERALALDGLPTESACKDKVSATLEERGDLNPGFGRAITPDTTLSFREKGGLYFDPDPGQSGCSDPPCGDTISILLRDNHGNELVYVLQRDINREFDNPLPPEAAAGHYREILLDPLDAFYERDLLADFSGMSGFVADGALLESIQLRSQHGDARFYELHVGTPHGTLRSAQIILDRRDKVHVIGGRGLDPSFPTVVLTHGWKPLEDPTDPFELGFVPLHIVNSAKKGIAAGEVPGVNFVTFQWAGAYAPGGTNAPTVEDRASAEQAALAAGSTLSEQLRSLLGPSYSAPLHMLGHSYGALAIAAAASAVSPPLKVDQLTILDGPEREDLFHFLLARGARPNGSEVRYVDNFYADRDDPVLYSVFGDPIRGAAENGGELFFETAHEDQFLSRYDDIMSGDDWVSAATHPKGFAKRPRPRQWAPPPVTSNLAPSPLNDLAGWQATAPFTSASVPSPGGSLSGMLLAPDFFSPLDLRKMVGSIAQSVSVGRHDRILEFEAQFLEAGPDDEFELRFGDRLIASRTVAQVGSNLFRVVASLGDFEGATDTLKLTVTIRYPFTGQLFMTHFQTFGAAPSAAAAKCGSAQLGAEGALLAAELKCASTWVKNPSKDPQQTRLASCEAAAQRRFAKAWDKALARGECGVDAAASEVTSRLDASAADLDELATSGENPSDPHDRALRSSLLASVAKFCSASLSAYGKNVSKPDAPALETALRKADQTLLDKLGAAIASAAAKGTSYGGAPPPEILAGAKSTVTSAVDATAP